MCAYILALLEEDENSRQVIECMRLSEHEVIARNNYRDAIDVLQKHRVELIVSDVHLENGGNIFDFLKWVKLNEVNRDAPFVLFSFNPSGMAKYLEDGIRTTSRILGADLYITMEAFDSDRFREQIADFLPDGIKQKSWFSKTKVNDMTAKILVTMEHEVQRTLIGDCLERVGHEVTKVDTFHNAMEVMRKSDFDLIISDVHLQNGGSVFDFLRWVKGDPHMRATPFVCFSAEPAEVGKYLSDGVRTAARSLGAARYISMNDFDGAVLLHEIEWLIPQPKAGSYYSGNDGRDGDGLKLKAESN